MAECYICGREGHERHHMLHGTANRKLAEEDGLVVTLCRRCHRNLHDRGIHDDDLKAEAEQIWLGQDLSRTIQDFISRYGKNYL